MLKTGLLKTKTILFNVFLNYYYFVLVLSAISNSFKILIPASSFIIAIILCIICFALSIYLFALRYEENSKMKKFALLFFILSIILLLIELFSLEFPMQILKQYNSSDSYYYEPNQFYMPYSSKLFLYYLGIISRIFYILNSLCFAIYFSIKILKDKNKAKKITS